MSVEAVVCVSCGAKFSATHARCPRCRTRVAVVSQPVAATASHGRTAAIVLAAFVIVMGVLWLNVREPARPAGPARAPVAAPQPVPVPSIQPAAVAAPVPSDPAFLQSPELSGNNSTTDDAARPPRSRGVRGSDPMNAEALAPLRQATQMRADGWPEAFTFAYACAVGQQWQNAVAGFRRAKVLAPNDPITSFNLALALHKAGDYPGAMQEYAAALALDPSAASAHLGLAISLDRQGKAAEAVAAYREALRLMPGGPGADRVQERMRRLADGPTAPR